MAAVSHILSSPNFSQRKNHSNIVRSCHSSHDHVILPRNDPKNYEGFSAKYIPFVPSYILEPTESHSLDEIIYQSRSGGLLEVKQDMTALKKYSGDYWRSLFNDRSDYPTGTVRHNGSGVWARKEWVLPDIHPDHIITAHEGNHTLLEAKHSGKDFENMSKLWITWCDFNGMGMTVLVSQINRLRKMNRPVIAVGCASAADATPAALATYCGLARIPAIVFLTRDGISGDQFRKTDCFGVTLLSIDTDYNGCMQLIKAVASELPLFSANFSNSLRLEGEKNVAVDILQQLMWKVPDWVIVDSENLENIYALYKGFRMCKELGLVDSMPRLVCAQSANASPLYQYYKSGWRDYVHKFFITSGSGLQQSEDLVPIDRAVVALQYSNGIVEEATEDEIMHAKAQAEMMGICTFAHTGAALTGVGLTVFLKLENSGVIQRTDRTVLVNTARDDKFTNSKIFYNWDKIKEMSPFKGITEVKPDFESVRDALIKYGLRS